MRVSSFDAIIIGGGHAGSEAAHALARMGLNTLLLTQNVDMIGHMSCNPAIGGLAKSQLVREVDALGGLIGRIADRTAIQYRKLNTSKGPAVRATRCQCDMNLYRREMQRALFQTPGLTIKQGQADRLIVKNGNIGGIITSLGESFESEAVVLTTGTFLRGLCHVGMERFEGGRAGDVSTVHLAEELSSLGFEMGRLKTGTTPRLDGRTIDWDRTEEQPPQEDATRLSYYDSPPLLPQRSCFITKTNERTHQIIRLATDRSPMFTGVIKGSGPRYCPSIEDKVVRFADKSRHQVFLEPQGLDTPEIYPNGLSTSLPIDVQVAFVNSIAGLERAEIVRPGYAVEYDFVQPTQLAPTLEAMSLPGLYLAGQINGTSGYEEAAAQGLMAGINAAQKLRGAADVVLRRDQAYIAVLIDDLVTKGTEEPYRMFTSRAEFRLLLREDNADARLSGLGFEIGLLNSEDHRRFQAKRQQVRELECELGRIIVRPSGNARKVLEGLGLGGLSRACSLLSLLRRPGATVRDLARLSEDRVELSRWSNTAIEAVELDARYAGYSERQRVQAERFKCLEDRRIPDQIDFLDVAGLSIEASEKLTRIRPRTLGQASRISGITPAAITSLMIHIGRERPAREELLGS